MTYSIRRFARCSSLVRKLFLRVILEMVQNIVPGFNDFVKELHTSAFGRPRSGTLCNDMRRSRLLQYAKSLMNKDMTSFCDSIRKSSNTRIPLASMIDNCTGEESIVHMWQDHYNSLLNSVKGNSSKQIIHDKLGTIASESKSILLINSDLNSALKSLKKSKACGVDGLAADHLFMLTALLMYCYLCYSMILFGTDIYQLIL